MTVVLTPGDIAVAAYKPFIALFEVKEVTSEWIFAEPGSIVDFSGEISKDILEGCKFIPDACYKAFLAEIEYHRLANAI